MATPRLRNAVPLLSLVSALGLLLCTAPVRAQVVLSAFSQDQQIRQPSSSVTLTATLTQPQYQGDWHIQLADINIDGTDHPAAVGSTTGIASHIIVTSLSYVWDASSAGNPSEHKISASAKLQWEYEGPPSGPVNTINSTSPAYTAGGSTTDFYGDGREADLVIADMRLKSIGFTGNIALTQNAATHIPRLEFTWDPASGSSTASGPAAYVQGSSVGFTMTFCDSKGAALIGSATTGYTLKLQANPNANNAATGQPVPPLTLCDNTTARPLWTRPNSLVFGNRRRHSCLVLPTDDRCDWSTTMTRKVCLSLGFVLTILVFMPGVAVHSQSVTREQLQTLAPNEQDLQGFIRVLPGSDTLSLLNNANATAAPQVSAQPVKDTIFLRNDPTSAPYWAFVFSETVSVGAIKRLFQSADGTFILDVAVILCDSPEAAHEQLSHLHWTAGMWKPGRWTGPEMIGDESLALVKNGRTQTLAFRYGSLLALIEGSRSNRSFVFNRALTIQTIPPAAVEAIAYQIVLRASQQANLTGGPAQNTRLAVNGHALPKSALLVGKQTYVPVREFARAMGLTSGWDAKTGALTLTGAGHKSVALTAGSTAATVGGAKAAALTVPVLKDGGEPVMALSDLLALTGGRVTGRAGNTVQVKG